ncbi:DUF3147 family protein [Stenotrophobium rhamnosiphilum]|uniref:DUF3147 domain-containing protein n=1 Tax=Stenotrophobium rhamnosiphilum TaxID=2029166 RepID=A0A2T5MB46_9GAMM|nr:DUF3147 family protein [Stenotrophobium rhamnosiphilum]PTU28214.1 hypothetical protein CJD38_17850 [Stenotrophobium rhamnosiphilum]
MLYVIKLLISAAIIVAITEVAKVNATLGGLIKALPLVSLITLIWIYAETRDTQTIAQLSTSTFWFVLPTLPMFLILPALLNRGYSFWLSLLVALIVMMLCYGLTISLLRRYGVTL